MCKKIVYIILGLILFIFFFPIKMAVDEGDVESYDDLEGYFITPTDATGGFWYTNDTKEGEIYFINLIGNSPEKSLSSCMFGDFETVRIKNKFIVYGKKNLVIKESKSYDMDIVKWDIVAPIKRDSLYGFIASSKYLTLWDFINRVFD